jgi:hypothetical protein
MPLLSNLSRSLCGIRLFRIVVDDEMRGAHSVAEGVVISRCAELNRKYDYDQGKDMSHLAGSLSQAGADVK